MDLVWHLCQYLSLCMYKKVLVNQSCPTLCYPMDCSPPGSSVQGILQARILEWVAIPFSKGSSQHRVKPRSPPLQAECLPSEPPFICHSVTKSCPTLCDPIDYSMPDFPVLHSLQDFVSRQNHVHSVSDAI